MVLDVLNPMAAIIAPIFDPLLALNPHIAIFIFSVILSAIIFFINKLIMGNKMGKELKNKLVAVKEDLMKAQKEGKKENVNKMLNEYMKINSQYLKQTLRVMLATIVVVAILFPWANVKFKGVTVAELPFSMPVIGNHMSWIVWYILVSFTGSLLLRKFIGE